MRHSLTIAATACVVLFGLIGPARAKHWIFTGRMHDAAAALAEGVADAVVVPDRLDEEALALEWDCYQQTLETEDRVEALTAFAEKREPRFRGR